jgi:hypothetical protein
MSVLLFDPVKKKHVLILRDGTWAGRRWSVNLRVCHNPSCGCFDINFDCIPDDGEIGLGQTSMRFELDTEQRSVCRDGKHKNPMPVDEFANEVATELGDEGWDYLQQFLLGAKKEQIENCDPTKLDVKFPPEVLRGDGTMVGYSEIFPLAPALSFSIGSKLWLALDDYCVSPDCNCHDVMLQFVPREYEDDYSNVETGKAPPAIFYDYRKKTFEQAQAPEANQPSLQSLLSGLKKQKPDFDAEAKKRHLRIKALFKRALSKLGDSTEEFLSFEDTEFEPIPQMGPAALHAPKPGRNDPCPCGSGKKYKKCCGL